MAQETYINKVTYDFAGEMGIGYTAKGKKFLFDAEDFDKIKGFCWRFSRDGYLVAFGKNEGRRRIIKFHQLVMGKAPKGKQIDHIRSTEECPNRKADNRKSNLRFVTPAQNSWNRGLRSDNKSGHTGVGWDKRAERWIVKVSKGKKSVSKRFPESQFNEACRWQEKTAKEMRGEYAYAYN